MIYFQCDYAEGAHPSILKRLVETNLEQTPGYMTDDHCMNARRLIKEAVGSNDPDVHFVSGGTQANLIVISSVLRPYQGVISVREGHVAGHETGAIEATGHKVLAIEGKDGKLIAGKVDKYIVDHYESDSFEHTVQPGMVYISFPTESGTIYTKDELKALKAVTRKWGIPLFVDGARLGYGLASPDCDITLKELAEIADVFYIGGTKCGALFGEAIVINWEPLKKDFRYNIKQRGAMFAKGRLLGIQFETLFTDDLYFKITKHAVDQAMRIRKAFQEKGIRMFGTSTTNQQFPILTKEQKAELDKDFVSEIWGETDDGGIITRFCTSWASTDENVDKLIDAIKSL